MVLIIDDDEDLRDALADLLARKGYEVLCARNGREALALLAEYPNPCLVLLDLVMPVMDGWQFLSAVQTDPVLSGLSVVIVSAHAGTHAPTGGRTVLRKPFELDELYQVVEQHCGPSLSA